MTVTSSIKSSLGDYATAQQWEDSIPADATEEYHGNIDEAMDANGVNINVSNTDGSAPTHRLRGGAGFRWTEAVAGGTTHGGVEGTKARIDNNLHTAIIISTNRIEIAYLEVLGTGASTRDGIQTTLTGSVGILIHHNLIRDCGDEGIYCQRGGVLAYNNVIYGCASIGIWTTNSTSDLTAYNNTIYGCDVGMDRTGGTFNAYNNVCLDNTTADYQGTFTTADKNGDSDTTAPGTTVYNSINSATFFVSLTGGAEDFHMASGNDGSFEGDDLSGTFTDDADGDTRSDWDIGAYEIIAAGGATHPPNSLMMMGAGV